MWIFLFLENNANNNNRYVVLGDSNGGVRVATAKRWQRWRGTDGGGRDNGVGRGGVGWVLKFNKVEWLKTLEINKVEGVDKLYFLTILPLLMVRKMPGLSP